jgi:hypothetical protein
MVGSKCLNLLPVGSSTGGLTSTTLPNRLRAHKTARARANVPQPTGYVEQGAAMCGELACYIVAATLAQSIVLTPLRHGQLYGSNGTRSNHRKA